MRKANDAVTRGELSLAVSLREQASRQRRAIKTRAAATTLRSPTKTAPRSEDVIAAQAALNEQRKQAIEGLNREELLELQQVKAGLEHRLDPGVAAERLQKQIERRLGEWSNEKEAETFDSNAELADEIVLMAGSEGGVGRIRATIEAIQKAAGDEGYRMAEETHNRLAAETRRYSDRQLVCAFIAEVRAQESRGLRPEATFTVSAHTVLRIVEALNTAGYSQFGFSRKATAET